MKPDYRFYLKRSLIFWPEPQVASRSSIELVSYLQPLAKMVEQKGWFTFILFMYLQHHYWFRLVSIHPLVASDSVWPFSRSCLQYAMTHEGSQDYSFFGLLWGLAARQEWGWFVYNYVSSTTDGTSCEPLSPIKPRFPCPALLAAWLPLACMSNKRHVVSTPCGHFLVLQLHCHR